MMNGYAQVDEEIKKWAKKHLLALSIYPDEYERRVTHLSSVAGDCFQIWIDAPVENTIGVHVSFIDGPMELDKEDEFRKDWVVRVDKFADALEEAYQFTINLMVPSGRYFPPSN